MKVAAVVCWFLAWCCSGLIVVAWFAARKGDVYTARAELTIGVLGAAGLALIGLQLW